MVLNKLCKVCNKELIKGQESTCSHACRSLYVSLLNKGRISPFKGKTDRWTKEQKEAIGNFWRGKEKSDEWKKKQSKRMKALPGFMTGRKQSEEQKQMMRENVGEKSPGWRGGKMTKNTRYHVLNRYGLTTEQYQDIFNKQNGVCAICKKPEIVRKNLSIDHDHRCCSHHKSCGKCIRGLLCFRCNQALGLLNDDIFILESARLYLSKQRVVLNVNPRKTIRLNTTH